MERFIHRALVAYIILSPFVIGSMGYIIHSRNAQVKEAQTELAWKRLEQRIMAPVK